MQKARISNAIAGVLLSLGLGAACSNGASSPPSAAGVSSPPTAASAPNQPAVVTPPSEASAAGSAAPSTGEPLKPVKTDPAPSSKADDPTPAEPASGLPLGPKAPSTPSTPSSFPREIPIDMRTVVQSTSAAPISGGTLAITSDDRLAVAADPDRDRVSIVDLWTLRATQVALTPGDEPGRIALDRAGRAYVALRRGGAVTTIDLGTSKIVERRAVCAAPRGISHDAASKSVIVACASGELVTLPETGTGSVERKQLASDLRDVLPGKAGLFVTRLKSAELVSLDASKTAVKTARPAIRTQFFPDVEGTLVADTLEPLGARRTIDTGDGFTMLHAGGRNGDIPVKPSDDASAGGSPYGGAGSCSGVVGGSITRFNPDGTVVATGQVMGTLAVDIAHSRATGEYAIALAGAADPLQPISNVNGFGGMPFAPTQPPDGSGAEVLIPAVLRYDPAAGGDLKDPAVQTCLPITGMVGLPSPATSVAYLADGRLVAQTREPATLWLVPALNDPFETGPTKIDLGGASVLDTGHEIFHRDAGAGVACASCHIEGGDDGHVWNFVEMGPRRTQSIHVGLEGTEPFHWIGDMRDLPTLMEHVFVGRMGGVHQTTERLGALAKWMYEIKAPVPLRPATDPAVERGRELFVGQAECGKCHSGPKLTNNETVDVGTGLALQVPSLVAVAYRGPWIHNGCAKVLRDRFDPRCGGTAHGKIDQLATAQIDDLVAYLESL